MPLFSGSVEAGRRLAIQELKRELDELEKLLDAE
jgi:hypothetical protein